ncbi:P-loop containing nucleoside triphosphate hydrolase [Plasmopara halstedii]|uniref:p-loop containing nucleoside triphosphate hydrolase n=1 Tax=Plasmopara halstedii TaxID=4781 RepID=A0A0P1A6Z2_PLAHL|nr:P-loop containing nucleoside triphosphate hydrolase [Plasmopara halstedii]CEG35958.1 P-loop containing nucleoside triphosphate hydrolase [Plasmopara halstedii]|eukprot:XP_024572327.1 P-loop containing nucleoside triphosphate hydrolase [Plasmopara halstedii]
MRSNKISIVGARGVGKTSFVHALGATESVKNAPQPQYCWQRPGQTGNGKTILHILRTPKEVLDSDDGVVVLLFNLMRRDSLTEIISQWAPLVDVIGRRLFLVGTHADCTSQREISWSAVREVSGEFDGYEEVCCCSGDDSMLRVQHTLDQWTESGLATVTNDIPLSRASICGGFPRPVVTMMVPSTTRCLPAPPARQRHSCTQAEMWLYDPNEEVSTTPKVTGAGGDVKLRTISKAIYDIRGAVAEKSKALTKYRDRQVSHWLKRSRYFGPTESSRHKRWQEEQKKHQLAQSQLRYQHGGSSTIRQSGALNSLQEQRLRSVSHPDKAEVFGVGPAGRDCLSSSLNVKQNDSLVTPFEHKTSMEPTESTKQWQRQLQASSEQEQIKRFVSKRSLRKQKRAISGDFFERSTMSATAYLDCYDEMDMPPQLQPISPLSGRLTSLPILSPASTMASSLSSEDASILSCQGVDIAALKSLHNASKSDMVLKLHAPDKPQTESIAPRSLSLRNDLFISRANLVTSSSSETFNCNDIDDMLECLDRVTLSI